MAKESTLYKCFFVLSGISGKMKCEANWSWHPAPFNDYDLWYCISGRGDMWINEQHYPVHQGTFFIFRPGDNMRAVHDPQNPITVIYCHFQSYHIENEAEVALPFGEERCVFVKDTYRLEPLLHLLVDLAAWKNQREEEEFDLMIKLILTWWERERNRQYETTQNYYYEHIVQQVRNEIRSMMSETIDYDVLAATVELTPRYLSSILKQYSGLSLKETITKLRMERAIHLLSETTMTVTEVSEALAYSDIYTFSKLFKRYYGFSPTAVRANRTIEGH
jgi:AraC-type DNA-binding domain-containing proteins